jgi:molybdopterin-synthase adenylyltransferase
VLTDDQSRRYSRHVLLKDVGGVGQEKLLKTPVRVRGGGTALETAATYLAAGGSPLMWEGPEYTAFFLAGQVDATIKDLNPDAEGSMGGEADVDPPRLECDAGTVFVGSDQLSWFPAPVCEECAEEQAAGRGDPQIGALAAIALQRLVLGLEAQPGAIKLDLKQGKDARVPPPRCPKHS